MDARAPTLDSGRREAGAGPRHPADADLRGGRRKAEPGRERLPIAQTAQRRVCIVGAGNIAAVHAEVLQSLAQVRVTAVVDPDLAAAERLARRVGASEVHACVDDALRKMSFEAAHVLTPPPLHCSAALPFLEAGAAVLVEKPVAVSRDDCATLIAAAARRGVVLGVNQNYVFHPAFARLRDALKRNLCGPARAIDCVYNMPLRQLAARQFGHWMFQAPGNLLLEQAVHPLSQIMMLAGSVRSVRAIAAPPIEAAPGQQIFPQFTAALECERLPAQLRFALGEAFPFWEIRVICDDGVLVADIIGNRCYAHRRTRWMEPVDLMLSGLRTGGAMGRDAASNLAQYALSAIGLRGRSDAFYGSMRASLEAFHGAVSAGRTPECGGGFGAAVVSACEAIAEAAQLPASAPARTRVTARASSHGCDVAVLGGTGFIGAHTVRRLVESGRKVSVLARSASVMEASGAVVLHRGDIRDVEALRQAIGNAPTVINLAHGGGGASFELVRQAMVGGAETVAQVALAAGVRRLVHVSSIAALYLGNPGDVVTGLSPEDPRPDLRADYGRCKALCERMLLDMHAQAGLPVCIVRPGLVVGEGTSPFHSGLGMFNNDQHCIGWNDGRNPLPFVLAQDVATAIDKATTATGLEGRCFNLVGDVRPSATEFLAELGKATGRPLRFHPVSPGLLWASELGKWVIKRVGGRDAPPPALRELRSRGLVASFDCDDAKRDLGWTPVSDRELFYRLALGVERENGPS